MGIFGTPSILKNTFFDGFQMAKLFRGFFPDYVNDRKAFLEQSQPQKIISFLEPKLDLEPRNWLLRFTLGDWYLRAKQYSQGLRVLLEAYKLRPKDPRSTYAVATAYRVLARASMEGVDIRSMISKADLSILRRIDPEILRMLPGEFDPEASADQLEEMNLIIDDVALKAIEFFEMTFNNGPRREEWGIINDSLQAMYSEFPHLEMKAKRIRKPRHGLFDRAITGSAGALQDAMDNYRRLRYLMNDIPRYRYTLGEIIRICQLVIAADYKQGDAYVLLANAYSLLDTQTRSFNSDPNHYKKWAAALLFHWANSPLCNYPFSKNPKIGSELYVGILSELSRAVNMTFQDYEDVVKKDFEVKKAEALNPVNFEEIRLALNYEEIR